MVKEIRSKILTIIKNKNKPISKDFKEQYNYYRKNHITSPKRKKTRFKHYRELIFQSTNAETRKPAAPEEGKGRPFTSRRKKSKTPLRTNNNNNHPGKERAQKSEERESWAECTHPTRTTTATTATG